MVFAFIAYSPLLYCINPALTNAKSTALSPLRTYDTFGKRQECRFPE